MVKQMMNKNTQRYPTNFTFKIVIIVRKCHSSDLIFKIIMEIKVQGSGQPNSDGTLFRGSHCSCSIKKVFLKILQNSQGSTCVGVSSFKELLASSL